MNIEHEQALVKAFIRPGRRDRWLALLKSHRGRERLLMTFAHEVPLDSRYAHLIPRGEQSATSIERLLRTKGAPAECYLMSEWSALDGRIMPLNEALKSVVGQGMGTFVSCLPGRLAYFEYEDPGERYLLVR